MSVAIEIIGWAGALLILGAYVLLTMERIEARSIAYQGMNLIGAIAFVINSGWNGAIPSASLNVVWAGIALAALIAMRHKRAG